ncbi:MAG: NFACT family protein [Oscillibacter sp.]|nr:NFACT family protein [Oscillibacter sp.]
MALDAVFLRAVTEELRPRVTGARVDKVFQPSRDRVVLFLRGGLRLLLCAAADAPRVQLIAGSMDNPAVPPMFCMLLRKHLSGGRLASLEQPSLERLVRLDFDTTDELGRAGRRTLILEAIPRRANLVLLDADGRIVDSLRRVDAEQAPDRPVLPGLFYHEPAPQDRLPFPDETESGFHTRLSAADPEWSVDRFLLRQYFGLSPLLARELSFRACGEPDARLQSLDGGAVRRLWDALTRLSAIVRDGPFTPYLFARAGQPFDFACVPVVQYGLSADAVRYPDCSALLDAFYEDRDRRERARIRGAELLRAVTTARDRLRRKLRAQEQDYAEAQKRDRWREYGDFIMSNLYRVERGQASLTCENFYDPDGGDVTVPLDPLLTPQQNAAKYYRRYARARNAEQALSGQIDIARRDIDYLESVLEELSRGETEQDFLDIRRELRESGFLRGNAAKPHKKEPKTSGRPREYRTASGLRILVGRNNRQNDALTKSADRADWWFHTQKIHGSHVILCTEGRTPSDSDITEAASVAAWWSQARDSHKVPVDYTPVRYVKKPAGARPGMVVYTTYRTTYVKPSIDTPEKL